MAAVFVSVGGDVGAKETGHIVPRSVVAGVQGDDRAEAAQDDLTGLLSVGGIDLSHALQSCYHGHPFAAAEVQGVL